MTQRDYKHRVVFPIGAKLVLIISILLLVSLGAVIFMVSALSTQDVQLKAEDNNYTVNWRAGSQADGFFKSIQESVLFYLKMTELVSGQAARLREMEQFFFDYNKNIVAFSSGGRVIYNRDFLISQAISPAEVEAWFATGMTAVPGQLLLYNASPYFQQSLTAAVFSRGDETVVVLLNPAELSESFGTGTNTSFMVNHAGDVLLHPDTDLVLGGANFSALPIVAIMQQEGDSDRRQVTFTDAAGLKYFGAYYILPGTGVAVVTTIPQDIVFEAVRSITVQNILLTAAVLFIAILFIWFFSKTISNSVRVLADAALRIEMGEFEVDLKPKTRDELGLLTNSFNKMSGALNVFGRFTNKAVAVQAMRGEIKPGGLPKHATIFFSDIRGFTEKSENYTNIYEEDASNHIVMWLNTYLTSMVECIEKTGGVVDKFLGDGIMAHWGTVYTAGDPATDAFNCVRAALMMREALKVINSRRQDELGVSEIRIGCGINSGVVTAGQIGSEQRMEYTVIGDPVNLSSRTESLNKIFMTDILITENTWELVKEKLITEEMPPVTVKGKEKPVRTFAVVNLRDAAGPQTLAELRETLGIPAPDIS